jgi:hypothetical protein
MVPEIVGEFADHPAIVRDLAGLPTPRREGESRLLTTVRMTAEASPLFIRAERDRRLLLSETGRRLHESNDRNALFRIAFWTLFEERLGNVLDSYTPYFIGDTRGFLLYVIAKYGDEGINTEFFLSKLLAAFPRLTEEVRNVAQDQAIPLLATELRDPFLRHTMLPFGLVESVDEPGDDVSELTVRKTALFDAVIEIRPRMPSGFATVH